jgi:hypothetical protein
MGVDLDFVTWDSLLVCLVLFVCLQQERMTKSLKGIPDDMRIAIEGIQMKRH